MLGLSLVWQSSVAQTDATILSSAIARPNIVLLLADDLGFSDIAPYGSEISTPQLTALAKNGVSFTNYHTAANCAPARAMLLTGVDSHLAGVPNIPEMIPPAQQHADHYQGVLGQDVVTVATLLQTAGYHTYMAGKWHLGDDGPEYFPHARGFERSFSMLQGGASHWSDMAGLQAKTQPVAKYSMDGKELTELPRETVGYQPAHHHSRACASVTLCSL